ncbi:MAG: hypothetical protein ACYS19_16435, partial [Planctomycetota bacterium]|jgi:hypothetical protein
VVRKKEVLDSRDLRVIDDFVSEAVRELVRTRDFTSIAKIRTVILSRKSTQGQYAQQFSESAHKHISAGLTQAETLKPDDRKTKVTINLLILTDGLEDLRLKDLAIGMLKNENMIIRYWAAHSLTNPGIIKQLNSGDTSNSSDTSNSREAEVIAEELKELLESSNPEIIALIAKFGADVKIPQGADLLGQTADVRIKRYADWTVKYELMDSVILKLLESKISAPSTGSGGPSSATGSSREAVARRFGQLYSYAIQRYAKGQAFLNDIQKQQLASILVETEEKCIGRLLGRPQTTIRRAIERENLPALLQEHNRLLGDETSTGELPLRLNFNYSGGRTAPTPLPEPPRRN